MKSKTAATLVLISPDKMTTKGRRDIANWLHKQARVFARYGKTYSSRFTARYLYRP